jgi:flagellar biosynthesis anti-sigma factor FlgM
MKISDQGFSERLPGQAKTGAVESTSTQGTKSRPSSQSSSSDSLQLSNLAAQLQKASAGDSSRSARVNAIAAAVKNGTFQVDPSRISNAIVSEAIQGASR